MKIGYLTLVVTDDCDFSCRYCYKRPRRVSMAPATAVAAVRYFLPLLKSRFSLNFYGGEPLLEFPLVRSLVEGIDKNPGASRLEPRFALTTNGSRLTPAILDFLEARGFSVVLSFDGLAQETHRKREASPGCAKPWRASWPVRESASR